MHSDRDGLDDPYEKLRGAISEFEQAVLSIGGYPPAISAMLRIYADEYADKYPDDTNMGRADAQ